MGECHTWAGRGTYNKLQFPCMGGWSSQYTLILVFLRATPTQHSASGYYKLRWVQNSRVDCSIFVSLATFKGISVLINSGCAFQGHLQDLSSPQPPLSLHSNSYTFLQIWHSVQDLQIQESATHPSERTGARQRKRHQIKKLVTGLFNLAGTANE